MVRSSRKHPERVDDQHTTWILANREDQPVYTITDGPVRGSRKWPNVVHTECASRTLLRLVVNVDGVAAERYRKNRPVYQNQCCKTGHMLFEAWRVAETSNGYLDWVPACVRGSSKRVESSRACMLFRTSYGVATRSVLAVRILHLHDEGQSSMS